MLSRLARQAGNAAFCDFGNYLELLPMDAKQPNVEEISAIAGRAQSGEQSDETRVEIIALFRLLMKELPPDHDVRTCPICRQYGITRI